MFRYTYPIGSQKKAPRVKNYLGSPSEGELQ
jgi:hypothetical protein